VRYAVTPSQEKKDIAFGSKGERGHDLILRIERLESR
jgi:hypothetical protein